MDEEHQLADRIQALPQEPDYPSLVEMLPLESDDTPDMPPQTLERCAPSAEFSDVRPPALGHSNGDTDQIMIGSFRSELNALPSERALPFTMSWQDTDCDPRGKDFDPAIFARCARRLWLEYDSEHMERQFVEQWLYRSQRMNVTFLALPFFVLSCILVRMYPPSVWQFALLCLGMAMFGGVGVLNTMFCRLRPTDDAEAANSARLLHERLIVVLFAAILVMPLQATLSGQKCLETYTSSELYCRSRIPYAIFKAVCSCILVPTRIRIKLPFILFLYPLAQFLPVLEFPGQVSDMKTAIRVCVVLVASALGGAGLVIQDNQQRANFEAWVVAGARAARAVELRQSIDNALAGTLPLSVARRLKTRQALCDVGDQVAVGVCELFGLADACVRRLLPNQTIAFLNELFGFCDHMVVGMRCHRLKAVGDTYLFMAGLEPDPRSAGEICIDVVKAAYAVLCAVHTTMFRARIDTSVKVLVHSGRAFGGVIGQQTLSYEVFGPAVEGASRGVRYCPRNCVVASEATRALCPDGMFETVPTPTATDALVGNLYRLVSWMGTDAAAVSSDASPPEQMQPAQEEEIPSEGSGADIRYDALRAAALRARREDESASSLNSYPISLFNQRLDADKPAHIGNAILHELSTERSSASESQRYSEVSTVVGKALLARVEQRLGDAAPTGWAALAFTKDDVEAAYAQFETLFASSAQIQLAVVSMILIVMIVVVAAADMGGFDENSAWALAVAGTLLVVSALWLAALMHDRGSTEPTVVASVAQWSSRYGIGGMILIALVYGTLALLPVCIVNISVIYCSSLLGAALFSTCFRCFWTGLALSLMSGATLALEFRTSHNLLPTLTSFCTIGALVATTILACFQRERAMRRHFEIACLSKAQLQACGDELAMQRRLYELLLPPFLAKTMIERKLKGNSSLMKYYDQLCVLSLRIDGLSEQMLQLMRTPQAALRVAETVLIEIEEALRRTISESCPVEFAPVGEQLLSRVSTLGDEVMLAGPMTREKPSDDLLRLAVTVALRLMQHFLLRDMRAAQVARRWRAPMSMVASYQSGFLVLLASGCLSLQVCGTGPWQAQALLHAAPRGFVGCTERFKLVAEGARADRASDCLIGPAEVWRVRGLGSTSVTKISSRFAEEVTILQRLM